MRKLIIIQVLLTSLVTFSFAQSKNLSREEKLNAIEMLSDFYGKPTPSKVEVTDVIARKGIPENLASADFDKKLALFTNSFYFKESSFHENEARIEADAFHLPNIDLIKGQFIWTKAVAKEGDILEIVPNPNSNSLSSLDFFNEVVTYKPKAGKPLNTIEGTFSFSYPSEIRQITLNKTDIGKTKDIEGETIKLMSIENDIAVFEITRRSEKSQLTYYALNNKGEPLELVVMRSEVPKTIFNILDKEGRIPDDKKKELVDNFDNLIKDPIISYVKALGTIDQLVVVKPKGLSNKKIPVVVHRTPDFRNGESALPYERYENQPLVVKYDKMPETSPIRLDIWADRTNDGYNNHQIILSVPNSPNSAYAKVEFQDVVATQAGKNVPFDPQGAFYNEKPKTYSFRLDPPSGDQPIECDLIKGKVIISYPVEITTQTLPVSTPADNFELANPITISYFSTDDDLNTSGETKPKRAYASNGMMLKRVEGYYKGGSSNGKSYMEYTYWGKPATIQIDKAIKWVTKEIPFTLNPAPKKPKLF